VANFNQNVLWSRLTAPELKSLAHADATVLVPVGSTEQHGPHLVTGTDSILVAAVCERAAGEMARSGYPCVVAPTVWTGLADHHVEFGGTFTLGLPTFMALLTDICASIRKAGFSKVVLVNGHGGNMPGLSAAAAEIAAKTGMPVYTTTYFIEAAKEIEALLEAQENLQHACEAETSMIWALRSADVREDRLCDGPGFSLQAALQPSLRTFEPFSRLTQNGVSGSATKATPEKGARLLAACADVLARRIAELLPVSMSV